VGAAVRSRSGTIYAGANLENASSGLTICAEAAALTQANSAGDLEIETIAVVGFSFPDPGAASRVVTPCGSCRQLIAEAAQLADCDVRVLCCSGDLGNIVISRISELLPNAFGPDNLREKQQWPTLREQLRARAAELTAVRKKL
jgi:cytidine deaminase